MTGSSRVMAAVAVIVTMIPIVLMRQSRMFLFGAWNYDSPVFDGVPLYVQVGALLLGALLLQVVPERLARPLLVIEGLVCLAAYGRAAPMFLGFLVVWFVALEIPLPKLARIVFALALLVALGLAGGFGLVRRAILFSSVFSVRLLMYAWDQYNQKFPRATRQKVSDYAVYMLAPPLVVFPPFLTYIPFFEKFSERIAPRWTEALVKRALKHLWLALAFAAIRQAAAMVPGLITESTDLGTTLLRHVFVIVSVGQVAHLTYGLMLLHGMDDRVPIDKPLLATDYLQYWSRFQIHQKDMQVALFYTPMLMRLRKWNRYLAITIAVAVTLIFGNTVLHVLTSYLFNLAWIGKSTMSALFVNTISTVALAGALCVGEWRRKAKRPAPRDKPYVVLCWLATFFLAARTQPALLP